MKLFVPLTAMMLFAGPLRAGELTVGFAETDITPEIGKKPVFMAGFGMDRGAKKVHDPLMARAVVLADGDEKIALVSVDVIGVFYPNVERIRQLTPGFKYVLVSATHNHEGPDTLGLWGPSPVQSGVDPAYLKQLIEGCVDAVKKADAGRRPAVARIGTANAPELLMDNRKPIVLHDELVAIRFADPKTDKPLGVLVQWNCHPEALDDKNTELTADYIGYTIRHLRDSQKCPVQYLTGTVGGLLTTLGLPIKDENGVLLKDGTFEKAERYGRLVGKSADVAITRSTPVSLTPFTVRTREVLIPIQNNIYRLAWQLGTLQRPLYVWEGNATPKEFTPTKDTSKPLGVRTEVGYLKLGDLEVAAIPGEIYPELVLGKVVDPPEPGADFPDAPIEPAIYAQFKGKHRMLIGLANDELGYFIPKRQWDEKPPYCYGLTKPPYGEINSVGPDTAPTICTVFRDLVAGKK